MKEIVDRLQENRNIELAKSILESQGYRVSKKSKRLKESANQDALIQALEDNDIDWKVAEVLGDGTAYVVTQYQALSGKELESILKPAGFTKGFTIVRDYSGYNPDRDITAYKTGDKRGYHGPSTPDMFGDAFGIEKEDHSAHSGDDSFNDWWDNLDYDTRDAFESMWVYSLPRDLEEIYDDAKSSGVTLGPAEFYDMMDELVPRHYKNESDPNYRGE